MPVYAKKIDGVETTVLGKSSAKSWLCHPGVDRKAKILPWGIEEDGPRVSPLEASARYLDHLRRAWDHGDAVLPVDHRLPASLVAEPHDGFVTLTVEPSVSCDASVT